MQSNLFIKSVILVTILCVRTINLVQAEEEISHSESTTPIDRILIQSSDESGSNGLAVLARKLDEVLEEIRQIRGLIEFENHKMRQLIQSKEENYNISTSNKSAINPKEIHLNITKSGNKEKQAISDDVAYKQAYSYITKKDYDEAQKLFLAFLNNYAESDYLPNVHYWLGEIYYLKNDFTKAEAQFSIIINEYPKSTRIADAMLKRAYVLIGIGKISDAKSQLQMIISSYPNTATAMLAAQKLDTISYDNE